MSVGVNPPKTPVHKGSSGIAAATVPNVCKMPGPPAPFVPTPLPNIAKSGDSPKKYTKKVKIEGNPVAVKGATFKSVGDMASKGTGGGIVSANTHGPATFIGPGSMDVKFEGKNVQLLSDPMTNNGGGSGNPPNAATLMGIAQLAQIALAAQSHSTCPSGHEWVQIEPSGKKSLDDKIDDLIASPKAGERTEGLAAKHNRDISKDLTKTEHLTEGDQAIRMMCNKDGCIFNTNGQAAPEHDHIAQDASGKSIVEVKGNPTFDPHAAKQIGRNLQAVQQGVADGLTMKYPSGPKYAWAVHKARKVAEALGSTVKIVRF